MRADRCARRSVKQLGLGLGLGIERRARVWPGGASGLPRLTGLVFGQTVFEQQPQGSLNFLQVVWLVGVALASDGNRGGSHTVASFAHERMQHDRRQQVRVLGDAFVL